MSKAPEIVTFGCRLNTYESEVMRAHAENANMEDVIIFNTCAVTKEAERQARQAIRKARRKNPDAKIIVTGCAAQIDPEGFGGMEEVDRVIGNDEKLKADSWGNPSSEKVQVNDIMSVKETASHLIEGFEGRARAFIQVQNGCDHRCTFCIIPYGRGNSRSVPIGVIAEQTKKLVESGYNEIVFTGVDVTSYGADLPGKPALGQMIRRVLALVPDLKRLRLSSLDPVEIDDDLWRLIGEEPRLMPHLHMSLQAGDDMVLKRMKRRHLRDDAIAMAKRARELRPDIVFGADIIAGFPTETDEMFENTLKIVDECDLSFLHVFPYSEREGTPAARMPQVDHPIRKERAARLREAGERQVDALLRKHVNSTREVIVEAGNIGRTEHFLPVKLDKDLEQGTLATVEISDKIEDGKLIGRVV
ncbi:MAG: tRNA (N(6)-L-threonylcarbamoyladenosine(37)-C(2))-methylthiotransferase MtaB [Pseudomonadota bacterium]|nr:tRNA (N(6)-L-threonylcarbamoyladenosine(37)-C(2))-methylthiotransferase MtaB [Pseudomonadota bacterium]MEC7703433.1 tRNA (N(6)-L-threonylcarbamoyladenosine(37)-C(2))-methylthiotransferase MtaB [Pseudomonadota bacterium]MEC9236347.1 tRNA (N(6)-L-threonylcarbamoyladenosine(37)-C(2))-methylthiotransferase MtaB [Pseudomonadota bacterium]MEE3322828.1 tRNA (N(6)-L-threonylcarbamoyladenosine(37)-C(2))-methylthiotransferase MtaB [Pseudomonadota bacterium]